MLFCFTLRVGKYVVSLLQRLKYLKAEFSLICRSVQGDLIGHLIEPDPLPRHLSLEAVTDSVDDKVIFSTFL